MTSKHTPGPWVIDGHNMSSIIRCTAPKGHPDAKHVCGDYETIADCKGDNWKANARLIAAAPDMLEALRQCSDWFIGGGIEPDGEALQRLIAKAEG